MCAHGDVIFILVHNARGARRIFNFFKRFKLFISKSMKRFNTRLLASPLIIVGFTRLLASPLNYVGFAFRTKIFVVRKIIQKKESDATTEIEEF
jgi:hypothetical protein